MAGGNCDSETGKFRYAILAASVLMLICLGGIYAWSTFTPPLAKEHGISASQAALIFGVTIAAFTSTMVFAGRLQERHGPRRISLIGSVLFSGGYILASFSDGHYPWLVLGIGIISGIGIGFCYICPLSACLQWFPSRKGLIVGITVGSFGSGGILWSAVAEHALAHNVAVLPLFRWIGIVLGGVLLVSASFMRFPHPHLAKAANTLPYHGVLIQKRFWLLVAGMFAGTFGGLLVIGNLKPMGMSMGLSPGQASLAISLFSIGNALGRLLWGAWYDGRGWSTIPLSLAVLSGSLLTLLLAPIMGTFLFSTSLIGFAFGACFVLYAAELASWLGQHNVGRFYPLIFLSYGAAGILGPFLGGFLFDVSSSFMTAVLLASALSFITATGVKRLWGR